MTEYKSKAYKISLAMEKSDFQKVKFSNSADAANYARQFYFDDIDIYESVFIILVNRANNIIAYSKISQGGCHGTVVDIKIICKYAVEILAAGVILIHNHPSGTLSPSQQDITLTKKVKEALLFMDSALLDHIIITSEGYYSFCDEGIL